jgi:hypothetical protein
MEVFLMEVIFMKINKEVKKEAKKEPEGWYKGYDIKWLRNEPEHPDFYLVAEYDKKIGVK